MTSELSEPSEIRFFDAVRRAYLEGWTGRLGLNSADIRGQLFFVGGDLYISPEHPFAAPAREWAESTQSMHRRSSKAEDVDGGSADDRDVEQSSRQAAEARRATRDLVEELGELLRPCAREACHFVDGAGQIRLDLIGPLPISRLIMEAAVQGEDESGLLRHLGGESSSLVAAPGGGEGVPAVELDPQEAFLISRLERPLSVGELLQQVSVERLEALQNLCRLLAVGLIRGESTAVGASDTTSFGAELVERLSERIAHSLEKDPVDLSTEEHRELLGNLLGRMGEMTFFELLAVGPQAEVEEVHRAFMELGRLVHPVHAESLALAGGQKALGILFERATQAYFTLSDSERRASYFDKVGSPEIGEVGSATEEERQVEMQDVARRNFQLARNLADRQEFHAAIQLLEQAVRSDPASEYLALLAECQAYNPRWLDRAVQNMSRAVDAKPDDGTLRLRFGYLLEKQGMLEVAREQYAVALEKGPEVVEAQEALDRLGSGPRKTVQKKGFSAILRSWLARG